MTKPGVRGWPSTHLSKAALQVCGGRGVDGRFGDGDEGGDGWKDGDWDVDIGGGNDGYNQSHCFDVDVVVMAMLKLSANERLRELGWKLILQVHDEVMMEGPSESAEEAKQILVSCMQHPFKHPLLVDLVVDAKIAQNWYDAK